MEIIGYLASVFIGISLGLIGGGGSILTLPVLVYLFTVDTFLATTYSLFLVGSTSLAGSVSYFRKGLIDFRIALFFGLPSIVTVFLTRHLLLPAIPENILLAGGISISKPTLLMAFFAGIMVLASYTMIKPDRSADEAHRKQNGRLLIIKQGMVVGMVTGVIGAGGGFLIIPALVNLLKLPMKTAIGTSLAIVAANSLAGFYFSISGEHIQWLFLLKVTAISMAGIFIGSYLSAKIDGKKLKPAFGWFVLVMGIYIIIKETIH